MEYEENDYDNKKYDEYVDKEQDYKYEMNCKMNMHTTELTKRKSMYYSQNQAM